MFSKFANLKLEKEFEAQRVKMLASTKKILDMYQGIVSANKDLFAMVSKIEKDEDYYPLLTIEQHKKFEKNYRYFKNIMDKQLEILNCLESNYVQQTNLRTNKKQEFLALCDKFGQKMDEGHQTFNLEFDEAYTFLKQVLAHRVIKYTEELKTLIASPKAKAELAELKSALSR